MTILKGPLWAFFIVHILEKFTYNKEDTKESPQSTSLLLLVLYGKYTISSIASDRLGCPLRYQVLGIPLHRYRSTVYRQRNKYELHLHCPMLGWNFLYRLDQRSLTASKRP